MVVKRGNKELRSFQVVDVVNTDGCSTKFKPGYYAKRTAQAAANNAFSKLCNLKNIRGKCSFYITVKDTTSGYRLKGKEYTYKAERVKLDTPVVRFEGTKNQFKILYKIKSKSVVNVPQCKTVRKRTKGVMKKHSRRTNKRNLLQKKIRRRTRKKMGLKTPGPKRISMKFKKLNFNNANKSSMNASNQNKGNNKRQNNRQNNRKNKKSNMNANANNNKMMRGNKNRN